MPKDTFKIKIKKISESAVIIKLSKGVEPFDKMEISIDNKITKNVVKSIDNILKKNKISRSDISYVLEGVSIDNNSTSDRILNTIVSALNS